MALLLQDRLGMLDTIGHAPVRYTLVYQKADRRMPWLWFLDPDFEHVEVWRDLGEGLWLALMPCHDYMKFEVIEGLPEGRVQSVLARRPPRGAMFPAGLKTCVSVVKAVLGLRHPLILTPRQLHHYVSERNGVL